jgi:phosphatidylglycerophosphate synthase
MNNRHTMRDIVASLPPEKRAADGFWTRFVLRPISFPASWLLLRLGLSADAVTYVSALLCVAGFVFIAAGGALFTWTGIVLFFIFGILDCADGNMARVIGKPNPWGEWVDAFGGYIAYATILLSLGIAAETLSGSSIPGVQGYVLPWKGGGWMLIGALASCANLLMRLLYQSFRATQPDPGKKAVGGEKKLSETIGITGLLVPLFAIGYATGFLAWVLVAYTVIYGGGCLLVALKLVRKVEKSLR